MAIDYGKKRTGIAVTDILQIIPNGLTTVATHELLNFLKAYTTKEDVERFVIGLPRQTNGKPSENFPRVEAFAKQLEQHIPTIPITFLNLPLTLPDELRLKYSARHRKL